ncbi:hypothetical protein [Methylopila sp. 73B]|uniref:hypothetical protein n=1 Tax=Methylopila sp. 73B TaxID=1120792 RepID=UPI000380010D|nr:hypothetical protein [Methylopila sp. 73B]
MTWMLVAILAALCLGLLVEGLVRPGGVYEFPFLAAAMSTAFVLPQLPGLVDGPFLPDGGFSAAVVFTVACLGAAPLGWRLARRPLLRQIVPLDETRLLLAAAALSATGAGFYVAVGRLPPEETVSVAISGFPVVLLFFSKMLVYGFAIAVLCAARRPSLPALTIALADSALYLDRVYVTGKRGEAFEFVLLIALAVWFQRRRALPRAAVAAALVLGMTALGSTEDYRKMTRRGETPGIAEIASIDFVGNFKTLLADGGYEFQNAVMRIDLTSRNQAFDYGLFHWNELVMTFVPSQLVGESLKRSLIVSVSGAADRFYEPKFGTTDTGMADAFGSFWWFGALKFLVVGWIMRRIYLSAMAGDAASQLLYMLSALPAMHIFSHHTNWIVAAWVQMALFVGPALIFAARRRPRGATAAA